MSFYINAGYLDFTRLNPTRFGQNPTFFINLRHKIHINPTEIIAKIFKLNRHTRIIVNQRGDIQNKIGTQAF